MDNSSSSFFNLDISNKVETSWLASWQILSMPHSLLGGTSILGCDHGVLLQICITVSKSFPLAWVWGRQVSGSWCPWGQPLVSDERFWASLFCRWGSPEVCSMPSPQGSLWKWVLLLSQYWCIRAFHIGFLLFPATSRSPVGASWDQFPHMAFASRVTQRQWVELWPPERQVHVPTLRTWEYDLFGERVFAKLI